MAISIISSVQSMARKLAASICGSPSSSSDQVLSGTKKDLESLERTLRRIQAVLNDAEEREIGDDSVKLWLKELRWVAYDAENVLGEYQYEIRRAEIMTSASAAETSLKRKNRQDDQVYDFTSVLLQLSIPQRIRDIMERFEEISKARKDLQLRDEDGPRRHSIFYVPQHSSSLVDESGIFGREDDKEAMIQMVLSDKESYGLAELTIYHSNTIIKSLGVENLTTLKRLELSVEEYHLSPDGWLPPMIQILEVHSCNYLESLSLHQSLLLLTRLEIWNCPFLASFVGLHNLPNLQVLSLAKCPKLQLLPNNPLPSSLRSLSVKNCKVLMSLPLLHEKLSSLEKLEVFNCPKLTIMAGLHNLSSLESFTIRQCPRLRLSSDEQLSSMPHFLSIADCPMLEEWCQQQSIPYSQKQDGESEEIESEEEMND